MRPTLQPLQPTHVASTLANAAPRASRLRVVLLATIVLAAAAFATLSSAPSTSAASLASKQAQEYFAKGNYEFPVVGGVALHPVIAAWAEFKEDQLNAAVFGKNNEAALKLMDRAGWK